MKSILLPPPQFIDKGIDYIEFLDSDDFLKNDCIEIAVKYAQQYQLDLVCAGINQVSNEYKKIFSTFGLLEEIKKNEILNGIEIIKKNGHNFFYGAWNILINFNFFNDLNLNFINGIFYEDHHFGTILFMRSKKIMVLDKFFYSYVNTIDSITRPRKITQNRLLLNFHSWKMTIEKLEQDTQTLEEKQIIQQHIKKFYFPMMCESFLLLDDSSKQIFQNEVKKNTKKYGNLKTFLMLNFPKIFFLLRKIKRLFRE